MHIPSWLLMLLLFGLCRDERFKYNGLVTAYARVKGANGDWFVRVSKLAFTLVGGGYTIQRTMWRVFMNRWL